MARDSQATSAEEPDGGNLHVRIWRGAGLRKWLGLLNKWSTAALALMLAETSMAFAGGQYTGIVKPVYWGSLYLDTSGMAAVGRPACATRSYVHLQEAESDPVFKNKFAMILSAWIAEKPLNLVGTGTCTSEGDEIVYVVQPG